MSDRSFDDSPFISRPDVEDQLSDLIEAGEPLVHITGEPGVGKTWMLSQLQEDYQEQYDVALVTVGEHYQVEDFYRGIYRTILEYLPADLKEEGRRLTGLNATIASFGGGAEWDIEEPDAPNLQNSYRDVLTEIADLYPEDCRLLICLDDVHKLASEEQVVRDAITEAVDFLSDNICLVTAGRLADVDRGTTVRLSTFTEYQSCTLLQQAFPRVDEETARQFHTQVDGHPLYIGLLIEAHDPQDVPSVPRTDVYAEIEDRYLRSLSPEEERFLLTTAPLHILDESICAHIFGVLDHDIDQVAASRLLRTLNDRVIVRNLGRNTSGLSTYKIHDTFRDFLLQRLDTGTKHDVYTQAFGYYAERLQALSEADNADLEDEVTAVHACLHHLSAAETGTSDELASLLHTALDQEGLTFYPASLILDEIKQWNAEATADPIVDTLIAKLDAAPRLARYFYDADADSSWAEELFSRARFGDPDNVLAGYLGQIVSSNPAFVQKVIQTTTTNDPRTLRYLLSLAQDLPPADAAAISNEATDWIRETDNYHDLASEGLHLVEYLCTHNEPEAALTLLDPILHPQPANTGSGLQEDQRLTRYTLTTTFEETFDTFLDECGTEFVCLLKTKLELVLQSEANAETGYEMLAPQTSFDRLQYADQNRGEFRHLLLEYLVQAATQWVAAAPQAEDRQRFVDALLDGSGVFRRIGYYLLANHFSEYPERVETVLLAEENYHETLPEYEFWQLVEQGFPTLGPDARNQVCEIIRGGPYWDVDERAEVRAESSADSVADIKTRITKKWQRTRLHPLASHLPDNHSTYLDQLLEAYGKPEQLPSQPTQLSGRGGFVNERGPATTEELRSWDPERVLSTVVEWEPPETDRWEETEDGQLEDYNHLGFSRQLRQVIKEQPEEYARQIAVLKEANDQYAAAAFRAFETVLDDGQPVPWDGIIDLGQAIASHPDEWSSRARTNLATLFNKGIYTEETPFPDQYTTEVRTALLALVEDPDPTPERDQPPEGYAGHGSPPNVAINSVRPMALNALITFASWLHSEDDMESLDPELREAIQTRLTDDSSLAVRSVLGRRLYSLWTLDEELITQHLEDLFPREPDPEQQKRFIAAWNQYTAKNYLWSINTFRSLYLHSIDLLETEVDGYQISTQSTAAHIAASYVFYDEQLEDEQSLIAQFYERASPATAADLPAAVATTAQNSETLEESWNAIKRLWRWRLDTLDDVDPTEVVDGTFKTELKQFLDCVRRIETASLASEEDLISRSFQFAADYKTHWWTIEEWFAEESSTYPAEAIRLYHTLVTAVPQESWPNVARMSRTDHRRALYENAATAGQNSLQYALKIANRFVAEGHEMDREFLDTQFDF